MRTVPRSSSTGESIMPNTLSAEARPRCSTLLTSVRCLSGAISISIAVMKEANSPTVMRVASVSCIAM
jgi:hypothetical protein